MWRSDRTLSGPLVATRHDVDALNRLFADAFTERYRRDGLSGVRVPFLNPAVWQFAIADAADGAMIWRDHRGDLVAFNIVHRSGAEGWMGPLAVRTDRQGHGDGQAIVNAGVAWLKERGVRTIGLETMPRTTDNIGFYSKLGFLPSHLTVTLQQSQPRGAGLAAARLGALAADERASVMTACRDLASGLGGGVDFTREIDLTLDHQLGDLTLLRGADGSVRAFALWHTAPLAQGRPKEELRVLKLVAHDVAGAVDVLIAAEREAATQGLGRMSLRCQTRESELYGALIEEGYRVSWTDLRMTLAGYPAPATRGVCLSNWEI